MRQEQLSCNGLQHETHQRSASIEEAVSTKGGTVCCKDHRPYACVETCSIGIQRIGHVRSPLSMTYLLDCALRKDREGHSGGFGRGAEGGQVQMLCTTLAAKPAAGYTTDEVPMVTNRSQLLRAACALVSTSSSRPSPNLQDTATL